MDILKSQEIARSTVEEARRHERLEEQVSDAANKVRLLDGEVHFNTVLGEILERLQATRGTLNLVQRATSDGRLSEAVNLIMQADEELSSTPVSQNTTVAGVLAAKITELRKDVVERLTCCWQACIHVDMARPSIRIKTGLVGK